MTNNILQERLSKMPKGDYCNVIVPIKGKEDFSDNSFMKVRSFLDLSIKKNVISPELATALGYETTDKNIDVELLFPLPQGSIKISLKMEITPVYTPKTQFVIGTFI